MWGNGQKMAKSTGIVVMLKRSDMNMGMLSRSDAGFILTPDIQSLFHLEEGSCSSMTNRKARQKTFQSRALQ